MSTMTNNCKLTVGFRVNPSKEDHFYFTSILSKSDIMHGLISAFELGRTYMEGNFGVNMADVSWFSLNMGDYSEQKVKD